MRYLSDIRASVRDVLRDEFVEGVLSEWETDELDRFIQIKLREVEDKMPYEVKDTSLTTTSGSKDVSISGITNLIRLRKGRPVEYPVGFNPKRFRNCTIFAKTISMEINILPGSGESLYVYCLKKHTLTDANSTLDPQHETLLIQGVTAMAAISKGRKLIGSLSAAGPNVGPRMIAWGEGQRDEYKLALKHHTLKDFWEALPKD